MSQPASPVDTERFLLRIAESLQTYGTPVYRLERVVENVATSLDVDAAFLATPTSITASFRRDGVTQTHLLRANAGEVNLGKLIDFDEVMEDVEHRRISAAAGIDRVDEIVARGSRWGVVGISLAAGLASAGAARFFGGGWAEIGVAGSIGTLLAVLSRVLPRRGSTVGFFEPFASFIAASVAFIVARWFYPLDDRLVTIASLIVLVPGLTLTIGLTELATRHLVAGVARLAGAAAVFLTMLFGFALAWRIGVRVFGASPHTLATPLPSWTEWLALATAPIAFGVLLEARVREFPVIFVTGVCGYLAGKVGAATLDADLGPCLGALTVGLLSNCYARFADRPALVPMTPGVFLLVPGSLGFRSLTSFLEKEAIIGMQWAFQTGMVAASLVAGLILANVLLPPRRVL